MSTPRQGPIEDFGDDALLPALAVEPGPDQAAADQVSAARRLRTLYILALGLIAGLTISSQVVIQRAVQRQDSDAPVINIAGRQRMFSQKLAKTALVIDEILDRCNGGEGSPFVGCDQLGARVDDLREVLAAWTRSHSGLQRGDTELGLPGNDSAEVTALFEEIEPHYEAMREAAEKILTCVADSHPNIPDNDATQPHIRTILTHEASFLEGMNDIVFQYDREAQARVSRLERTELILASVILLVLLCEAFLVFAPAARVIRRQFTRLRESEERYRILAERNPHGIQVLDPTGIITYVNPAYQEMLGYTKEELLGKHIVDLLEPASRRPELREYLSLLVKEQPEPTTYFQQNRRKDGEVIEQAVDWDYSRDGGGNVVGFISVITDITEHKQAEEAKRITHELLEIAFHNADIPTMLKEFVSAIQGFTRCSAVGIRLLNENREVPYEAQSGFSRQFYELESPLKIDSDQCMCLNVIRGNTDPSLPFFTPGGSFFVDATTRFLSSVSDEEKGQTRNACNQFGYECVALIPIRDENGIHGLIHIADPQEHRFPLSVVEHLEKSAMQLGAAILRRRAEEAQRESERRFRTLVESAPIAIYETDAQSKCLYVNEKWRELAGLTLEEALGDGWQEGLHKEDRAGLLQLWREHAQQQKPWDMEYRFRAPDGKISWVMGRATALRDAAGRVTGYLGANVDITERKRAEEALRKVHDELESRVCARTEELRQSNEELEMFAHCVSHDLKAPLRAIEGFADALGEDCRDNLDDDGREYLREISGGATRMGRLIEDLLSHARLGRGIIAFGPVALAEVIDRAKETLQPAIKESRATIRVEGELPTVEGHRGTLVVLFQNLLDNALKFVAPGSRPEIVISAADEPMSHRISVCDNGIGIEEQYHRSIFDVFQRLHTNEVYPGTGIGLAIVKKAAGLHGGEVWCESEPGSGTTFHAIIPKHPPKHGNAS